jgi:hypothetical protein
VSAGSRKSLVALASHDGISERAPLMEHKTAPALSRTARATMDACGRDRDHALPCAAMTARCAFIRTPNLWREQAQQHRERSERRLCSHRTRGYVLGRFSVFEARKPCAVASFSHM